MFEINRGSSRKMRLIGRRCTAFTTSGTMERYNTYIVNIFLRRRKIYRFAWNAKMSMFNNNNNNDSNAIIHTTRLSEHPGTIRAAFLNECLDLLFDDTHTKVWQLNLGQRAAHSICSAILPMWHTCLQGDLLSDWSQ